MDKRRKQELVSSLQKRKDQPEFLWFRELVEGMAEEAVNSLVDTTPELMLRFQGRAQAYKELLRLLERPSSIVQLKEIS